MTTFNGTKVHDTLFDLTLSDLMLGIAGNDSPTGDAGEGFAESAEHEGVTRPHADGVLVLHGDFSSLVDTDAAIAAATDELIGNYNFVRIEPTASEFDPEVKSQFAYQGLIGDTGDSLVATALLHGDFSSLVDTGGMAGTDTVIEVDPIVLEPGQHKEELVGRLKYDSEVVDYISLEPTRFENVTRPHADGVLVLHGDFSSLVDTDAAIAAATEELFGNYNFLRIEPTSSEVDSGVKSRFADEGLIGDTGGNQFGSKTGTSTSFAGDALGSAHSLESAHSMVDGNGNDAKIVGIVDGSSNTVMFGRTDGSAASNVVEAVAVKYTMFDGEADGLSLSGNGTDRLARQADLGMHSALRGGDVLDVGELSVVLSDTDKNVANGPAGKENLNGNINNIDAWVGGVVLDVGDVLVGFDDGVDNSNDSVQTRTAGGNTTLPADPDGQVNGIIAVLIGLSADIQGPLNSLALD